MTIIDIYPKVPKDATVVGHLYWSENARVLGEDMIEVVLKNGILVSCGWYPEGDKNGTYKTTVSKGLDELDSYSDIDILEAMQRVEYVSNAFNRN